MNYHLFEVFGVELEYMVVDRETLKVRPIVDQFLKRAAQLEGAVVEAEGDPEFPNQVALGDVSWSNELVLHVLELKTTEPAPRLAGLDSAFAEHIARINTMLAADNAMLLPTGMHPTMNPFGEMKLWPHDYGPVYDTFNRIFDCRGHGWANLQAVHLNLPFDGADAPESEFGRLHAAVRAILPVLPALSASTPFKDGGPTGLLDNRLEVYRTNSARIPAAAGKVIPEPVFTHADYERVIFREIFRQYAPHDPEGVLRYEWANSRGAIARFMRNTIEVRVLDVQEAPCMDVAICAMVAGVVRAITEGRLGDLDRFRRLQVDPMHAMLLDAIRNADESVIRDADYLGAFGLKGPMTTRDFWTTLTESTLSRDPAWSAHAPHAAVLLKEGCLARRILRAAGPSPTTASIHAVYRRLAQSLAKNTPFVP